jgi:hypothetical protein
MLDDGLRYPLFSGLEEYHGTEYRGYGVCLWMDDLPLPWDVEVGRLGVSCFVERFRAGEYWMSRDYRGFLLICP